MKKISQYLGVILIIAGIAIFAIDYFFKANSNTLLIIGLVAVLLGVAGQIITMKKEGTAIDKKESAAADKK